MAKQMSKTERAQSAESDMQKYDYSDERSSLRDFCFGLSKFLICLHLLSVGIAEFTAR